MLRRLVLTMTIAALATAPAFAFNPQPDPPGRSIKLADGSLAILGTDHRVSHVVGGQRVYLPPGPCKLQNGVVLTLDAQGKVKNEDAPGGEGNLNPVGGSKRGQ